MILVNWNDAQTYATWLNEKTRKAYRLLSEAEWEYVARAGSETAYHWGDQIGKNRPNCDGCGSRWDGKQTAPVGMFAGNGFGLHDVHGNVWEWVEDCWNETYAGAPADGSAWAPGTTFRGTSGPRTATGGPSGNRSVDVGFRVARSLTP